MKIIMLASAWIVVGTAAAHAQEVPAGRLGSPLGTYVTIAGVRAEGPKSAGRTLLVNVVNGRQLDQPIAIAIENVDALPAGTRCVFRGYENGKTVGTPPAIEQAAKEAGQEITVPQAGWQFYRYFMVISVDEPADFQKRATLAPIVNPRRVPQTQLQQAPPSEDPGPAGRDPSIAWNLAAAFMAAQSFAGKYSRKGTSVYPVAGVPDSYDVFFKPLDPTKANAEVAVRVDIRNRVCTWLGERRRWATFPAEPNAGPERPIGRE